MNKEAVNQLLRGIDYIIEKYIKKTTKCYDGIILSKDTSSTNKWNIRYNGEVHSVALYGSNTPTVGQMVKVIIPQGNQALAWFFV